MALEGIIEIIAIVLILPGLFLAFFGKQYYYLVKIILAALTAAAIGFIPSVIIGGIFMLAGSGGGSLGMAPVLLIIGFLISWAAFIYGGVWLMKKMPLFFTALGGYLLGALFTILTGVIFGMDLTSTILPAFVIAGPVTGYTLYRLFIIYKRIIAILILFLTAIIGSIFTAAGASLLLGNLDLFIIIFAVTAIVGTIFQMHLTPAGTTGDTSTGSSEELEGQTEATLLAEKMRKAFKNGIKKPDDEKMPPFAYGIIMTVLTFVALYVMDIVLRYAFYFLGMYDDIIIRFMILIALGLALTCWWKIWGMLGAVSFFYMIAPQISKILMWVTYPVFAVLYERPVNPVFLIEMSVVLLCLPPVLMQLKKADFALLSKRDWKIWLGAGVFATTIASLLVAGLYSVIIKSKEDYYGAYYYYSSGMTSSSGLLKEINQMLPYFKFYPDLFLENLPVLFIVTLLCIGIITTLLLKFATPAVRKNGWYVPGWITPAILPTKKEGD